MVSLWFLVELVEIYQMTYRYMGSSHFLIPKNYWYTLLMDIAAGGGVPPTPPQGVPLVKFDGESIATIKIFLK